MTNKLTIIASVNWTSVRQFCIDHSFYTAGTQEQYEKLMDYVNKHKTLDMISLFVIVSDIISHSDICEEDWISRDSMYEGITDMFLTEACQINLAKE